MLCPQGRAGSSPAFGTVDLRKRIPSWTVSTPRPHRVHAWLPARRVPGPTAGSFRSAHADRRGTGGVPAWSPVVEARLPGRALRAGGRRAHHRQPLTARSLGFSGSSRADASGHF